MPVFNGGPLDGQVGYSPQAGDPPPDMLASLVGAGGGGGEPDADEQLSPAQKFDRILSDARSLAAADGQFTEADRLVLEQVTTLLQKLKAKGEKDVQTAMSGRMSPAVGKAYASGA